ncbi:MAG: TfoX/Sxy family protein [Ferrovibrio sp.]
MPADDFTAYVMDCLNAARVGPVTRERLFSGSGLRIDGVLFGVILRGTLFFVVDEQTRPRFIDAGMGPFRYSRKDVQQAIERWYELPEDVLLDAADLRDWVHDALAAARRTAKPERPKQSRVKKPAAKKPAVKKAVVKKAVKKPAVKKPVAKRRSRST